MIEYALHDRATQRALNAAHAITDWAAFVTGPCDERWCRFQRWPSDVGLDWLALREAPQWRAMSHLPAPGLMADDAGAPFRLPPAIASLSVYWHPLLSDSVEYEDHPPLDMRWRHNDECLGISVAHARNAHIRSLARRADGGGSWRVAALRVHARDVKERDERQCVACGWVLPCPDARRYLHCHHLRPQTRWPGLALENGVALCWHCPYMASDAQGRAALPSERHGHAWKWADGGGNGSVCWDARRVRRALSELLAVSEGLHLEGKALDQFAQFAFGDHDD